MRTLLIALLITLSAAACCKTQARPGVEPLPMPARPLLPHVTSEDLACVPDDAYRRLTERERLMREYTEMLETIIGTTRAEREVRLLAI